MCQKNKIQNFDWDFLVILDACRYDLFNELFPCKKVISPATWTLEWLEKTWKSYYDDIIYISSNPLCNSLANICKTDRFRDKRCFFGKKHFFKVIDVWDKGWNQNIGTVHPSTVNKYFHKTYLKYPKKKYIIHYMPPHKPYITIGGRQWDITQTMAFRNKRENYLKSFFIPASAGRLKSRVLTKLNVDSDPLSEILLRDGSQGVIKVYKNEIKEVMKHVRRLYEHINGRWIITADHGERLDNFWLTDHCGRRDKEVIEVPWFIVENKVEMHDSV